MTDRARRYRAQRCVAPGPPACHFCGIAEADLGEKLQVHHLNGREADGEPKNLLSVCRSCNQRADRVLKRAGLGIRTSQFNPVAHGARSVGAWLTAVMSMKGESDAMTVPAAVEMIRATPARKRMGLGASRLEFAR